MANMKVIGSAYDKEKCKITKDFWDYIERHEIPRRIISVRQSWYGLSTSVTPPPFSFIKDPLFSNDARYYVGNPFSNGDGVHITERAIFYYTKIAMFEVFNLSRNCLWPNQNKYNLYTNRIISNRSYNAGARGQVISYISKDIQMRNLMYSIYTHFRNDTLNKAQKKAVMTAFIDKLKHETGITEDDIVTASRKTY